MVKAIMENRTFWKFISKEIILHHYLTPVVAVFISEQGHLDADMFFYMLIVFSTISSLYTLIWDLRMDWGLFDRGAGENTFLREEIVYPHKVESLRD